MINIPTISQLYTSILADIEQQYGVTIPLVGKNFLRVMAGVQAAKLKIYYLAIGSLQKNIYADLADPESLGGTLERFGRIKLGRNPFQAISGQYQLMVTGTIGSTVKANTTFKSNDDSLNPGNLYIIDEDYTLVISSDYITVRALTAGQSASLNVLDKLTSTVPIIGVNKVAIVESEVIEPLDQETIEDYRSKILLSDRLEAQGGASSDFRLWSLDAQGVKTSYAYAKTGESGVVNLFIEATTTDSIDGKGTPTQAIIDEVESVVEFSPDITLDLNERGRRPLGVFQINFLPVSVKEIKIYINDFENSTPTIEQAILDEVESKINLIRPFVPGSDILADKNDILDVNKIISMILNANPGAAFGLVTFTVDNVNYSTYTFDNGNIPNLDSVNYL